jgi:tRNA/rRNA methyltransferase
MDETALAQVRIVLVQSLGPRNVGSVARAMKNMGLHELVLVDPRCDPLDQEARIMAVHAIDVLESAQIVATLPEALAGCTKAIATTSRSRYQSIELDNPRTTLPWLLESGPSALIFGSEDQGLSNDQLKYAQKFVRIPSSDAYPSLNLAQAVGVCCYELYQAALAENGVIKEQMATNACIASDYSASLDFLDQYYLHLEAVLLKIGYLYPHTAPSRMAKFRQLFNRSGLSTQEVVMLRGILRQIEWAIDKNDR